MDVYKDYPIGVAGAAKQSTAKGARGKGVQYPAGKGAKTKSPGSQGGKGVQNTSMQGGALTPQTCR